MIRKIQSLFILFLITGSAFAQTPFISNYTSAECKAGMQNWDIEQDQRGVMYFANKSGVLEYDGINWRTIATPSSVFSLCIDSSNRIYVGLNNDFGYLLPDSIGNLEFKSLKHKIPKEYQNFKIVWGIKAIGEKIILRTVNKFFIYQNDSFSVLKSTENSKKQFVVRGNYYIPDVEKGLMLLEGDSLVQMPGKEKFAGVYPLAMLPYGHDEILIFSMKNGIEIYNPKKIPYLRKPDAFDSVSKLILKNQPYVGVKLANGHFAISTLVGGIFVFDKKGKIHHHYNKQNGLQGNRVYSLFVDLNEQLWAALENGNSLIMNNLPIVNYTDKNGLDGAVYCVQKFKDKLYVGTSNYLYIQNTENDFERVEGTTGQNFFLFQGNRKLLLGNNPNGLLEINTNEVVQQSETLKQSVPYVAKKLRKFPNFIISQVWNKGLALIEYKNEQWVFKHFIKGFDKNAMLIEEDDKGNFWLYSNNQLYKTRFNETLDSVTSLQYYDAEQYHFPKTSARPYRLNSGEIIFITEEGIYRYLPSKDYFELHPDYSMFPGGVNYLKQDSSGNVWFEEEKEGSAKGVLRLINGKYEIDKTPFLKFKKSTISNPNALYPYSDSIVYIGTNNGLLEYHPKQKVNYDIPFNTLIRKIFIKDSLIYGGATNDFSLKSDDPVILEYKDNNLFFHYAATFYEDSEKNLFSYRLMGSADTTWSGWTNDHKKEYSNLHEGKYVFEVKSKNIYQKIGKKASFPFGIRSPWYRALWAYVLYLILASVFVWLLIRINSVRLKRLNEILKQTVEERTADILEQKDKILHQKKDIEKQSEKLRVTNDKLVETNATKDKFFSIISHDLRSPFNSILGFSNLLNNAYDSIDDDEKKEMIRDLNKSSQHAYDLLSNLLTWARTQTDGIKINKERLDLKELVETSIAPYVLNASGKDIKIVINIPCETMFSIDKNTAITVIGNLVNNAIKFTPEGGTITINYNESGDNIELHIIDTGVGMTAETIEKLFRIDENISTNGTNNEKGTGLGLILCKEFINKNGGDISVISEVGKGSEFIITLSK